MISTLISSSFFPVIYLDEAEKVVRSFPSESKLHLTPEHQARTRVWELLFSNKKVDVEGNYKLALCRIASSCGGTKYAQYLVNHNILVSMMEDNKASLKPRFRILSEQLIEQEQKQTEELLEKYLFVSSDSREVLSNEEELAICSFQITTLRKERKLQQLQEEAVLSPPVRAIKRKAVFEIKDNSADDSATEVEESGSNSGSGSGSDGFNKSKRTKLSAEQRKRSHVQAQQRYYAKKKQHQQVKKVRFAGPVMATIVPKQTVELCELKNMRQQMETLLQQIKNREDRLQLQH